MMERVFVCVFYFSIKYNNLNVWLDVFVTIWMGLSFWDWRGTLPTDPNKSNLNAIQIILNLISDPQKKSTGK